MWSRSISIHVKSDDLKIEELRLFSLSGNLLMVVKRGDYMDVQNISNGIYYLWVNTRKGVFYEQVVIHR